DHGGVVWPIGGHAEPRMHGRFSSGRSENKRWPAVVLHRARSRDGGSEKVDFEPATTAGGHRSVANRWPDVSNFKSGGSVGCFGCGCPEAVIGKQRGRHHQSCPWNRNAGIHLY